ncbi:unnamed protein product [Euphydryas editha]|uniref:Uncharacterized protein n=1 Tax=Euphydryas editha TaxID=104508 RepID=A0AAU9U9T8_EUPED|nr:unnamed protein product [Euphydryas editha]
MQGITKSLLVRDSYGKLLCNHKALGTRDRPQVPPEVYCLMSVNKASYNYEIKTMCLIPVSGGYCDSNAIYIDIVREMYRNSASVAVALSLLAKPIPFPINLEVHHGLAFSLFLFQVVLNIFSACTRTSFRVMMYAKDIVLIDDNQLDLKYKVMFMISAPKEAIAGRIEAEHESQWTNPYTKDRAKLRGLTRKTDSGNRRD